MGMQNRMTAIILFCPNCKGLQEMNYIVRHPNITYAGCQKCKKQFSYNEASITLNNTTATDYSNIRKTHKSDKLVI